MAVRVFLKRRTSGEDVFWWGLNTLWDMLRGNEIHELGPREDR